MKKYLLANTKNSYKANLHAHTDISDGKFSPEALKELYKSAGYSVVAYTDHDILIPHHELTDSEFIALTGFEAQFNGHNKYPGNSSEKKCHICFIAKSPDVVEQPCFDEEYAYIGNCAKYREQVKFDKESYGFKREYTAECINEMVRIAKKKGFFVTYNHPAWSLETYEEYTKYTEFDAIEVYNNACNMIGITSSAPYAYDDMLRGGQRLFPVAADDTHRDYDAFGGFVMIKADELKYEKITEALANGDFYASMGPLFREIYIEDGKLVVRCSDVVWVGVTTDTRRARCKFSQNGEALNEVEIPLDFDYEFFRITVKDAQGRFAYSNAFFKDAL